MKEFEVVTNFYTMIPWITGSFIVIGIVLAIALSLILGWWIGAKSSAKKSYKTWFALGWIPIFAVFVGSVFSGSMVYYDARNSLSRQVQDVSGINVITFVRGNEYAFVGSTPEGDLTVCNITALKENERYRVNCS